MISEGCKYCYMFRSSPMFGRDPEKIYYFSVPNILKNLPSYGPLVFVNDNTDTFGAFHSDETRDSWFDIFWRFEDKQFQLLTKRADLMAKYFETRECPPNVWLGVSCENKRWLSRLDYLRQIDCNIRYVSFEPLIGPIEKPNLEGIHWIIIGGESGSDRVMKPEWAQDLIDYTRANYPDCCIFFKQMGGKEGKDGAGGCLLNGREIKEFPKY